MTIQQIVEAFEKKGFKVHKFWNQCTPSEQGYYEFTIIKDDTYVGGRYEWRPELSPDVITLYQRNFINELLDRWEKEHDRYCRKKTVEGIEDGMIKQALNSIYGVNTMTGMFYRRDELRMKTITTNPKIKDVIFNDPATIVFWSDGTKTVVKCQEDDIYDPEKGLAMAISKKVLGGNYDYYNTFKKYLKKYKKQEVNSFEFSVDGIYRNVDPTKFTVPKLENKMNPVEP
jgi:hypothetical protein